MNSFQGTQAWPDLATPPTADSFAGDDHADHSERVPTRPLLRFDPLPLLIQVPAVPHKRPWGFGKRQRPTRRPVTVTSSEYRFGHSPRKRRLRREIRLTGTILATAAPLLLAAFLLRGRPAAGDVSGNDARPRPTAISLSIDAIPDNTFSETISTARPGRGRDPVVAFPGYLLPEDRVEEPAHAGH